MARQFLCFDSSMSVGLSSTANNVRRRIFEGIDTTDASVQSRASFLATAAAFWIVLPALLYALGWTVGWIVRGSRASE